jgi:hypothetical protein
MPFKFHRRKHPLSTKEYAIEAVGWYGVVAIVSAYLLISIDLVIADSWLYQMLNLTGAIGILIDSWHAKNYQPAVLNLIWLVIAGVAIGRLLI